MKALPSTEKWLEKEPNLPAELKEALKHHGLLETAGKGSNVDITRWAKEVGVDGWYPDDSVAWCGLFKGVCAFRAGWIKVKHDLLSALAWLTWGDPVAPGQESLGDTLVFVRPGGGHVGYYIGETKTKFRVLGGNQSDSVSFTWIAKDRLKGCRRAHWKTAQPAGVRKVYYAENGEPVSTNEC